MTKKKPGEFEGLTPSSQIKLATYGLCNVALNATEGGIPARLFAQCMLDTAIGILVHENAGDSSTARRPGKPAMALSVAPRELSTCHEELFQPAEFIRQR